MSESDHFPADVLTKSFLHFHINFLSDCTLILEVISRSIHCQFHILQFFEAQRKKNRVCFRFVPGKINMFLFLNILSSIVTRLWQKPSFIAPDFTVRHQLNSVSVKQCTRSACDLDIITVKQRDFIQ